MALPIRTIPSFPAVPLFHQETSISLLSLSVEGRKNENHNHRKVTTLITWTTSLSNSMKLLAMRCRATQDKQVMAESSDKTWSIGEGNGKPLQYSCLENNPMTGMKRKKKKNRTMKDEISRFVGA